jgi:hypothetical protein
MLCQPTIHLKSVFCLETIQNNKSSHNSVILIFTTVPNKKTVTDID